MLMKLNESEALLSCVCCAVLSSRHWRVYTVVREWLDSGRSDDGCSCIFLWYFYCLERACASLLPQRSKIRLWNSTVLEHSSVYLWKWSRMTGTFWLWAREPTCFWRGVCSCDPASCYKTRELHQQCSQVIRQLKQFHNATVTKSSDDYAQRGNSERVVDTIFLILHV